MKTKKRDKLEGIRNVLRAFKIKNVDRMSDKKVLQTFSDLLFIIFVQLIAFYVLSSGKFDINSATKKVLKRLDKMMEGQV